MKLNFHHICIETNCYNESLSFYTRLLGFEILEESKGFHGRDYNTWIQHGNVIIEMQTPKKNETGEHGIGNVGILHVCFKVANLDDAIDELTGKGFSGFIEGKKKYEVKGGRLSKMRAPEGTIIELRE